MLCKHSDKRMIASGVEKPHETGRGSYYRVFIDLGQLGLQRPKTRVPNPDLRSGVNLSAFLPFAPILHIRH